MISRRLGEREARTRVGDGSGAMGQLLSRTTITPKWRPFPTIAGMPDTPNQDLPSTSWGCLTPRSMPLTMTRQYPQGWRLRVVYVYYLGRQDFPGDFLGQLPIKSSYANTKIAQSSSIAPSIQYYRQPACSNSRSDSGLMLASACNTA